MGEGEVFGKRLPDKNRVRDRDRQELQIVKGQGINTERMIAETASSPSCSSFLVSTSFPSPLIMIVKDYVAHRSKEHSFPSLNQIIGSFDPKMHVTENFIIPDHCTAKFHPYFCDYYALNSPRASIDIYLLLQC